MENTKRVLLFLQSIFTLQVNAASSKIRISWYGLECTESIRSANTIIILGMDGDGNSFMFVLNASWLQSIDI